jgi:predicted DNA-binding transcriptional regulator AlpA
MDIDRFLTVKAVSDLTSLSRATIDRKAAAGEFSPIKISDRRKVFRESEVLEWMKAKAEAA